MDGDVAGSLTEYAARRIVSLRPGTKKSISMPSLIEYLIFISEFVSGIWKMNLQNVYVLTIRHMSLGATPSTHRRAHTRPVRYRRKVPVRIHSVLACLVHETVHPPLDLEKAEPRGRLDAGPSRTSVHPLRRAA